MLSNRLSLFLASLMIALSASTPVRAVPPPSGAVAEGQLRALNHRFVESFARRDVPFMEQLTSDNFVRTSARGAWMDRAAHIQSIRESTAHDVSYDDVRIRLFGDVAILHAVFNALGDDGMPVSARYTDVYQWNGSAWKLVSGQNTRLAPGAAVAQHTAAIPAHAAWSGTDPTGEDLDVLLALNANYVDAFRRADVSWYAAHLAPDYVVVNPDGSFGDRSAALADFAQPTFAEKLASFPVDEVKIRRFADTAVIHAQNAYTRKDGTKGVSRYTDIWQKRDGRWVCIAAHITPVAMPQ